MRAAGGRALVAGTLLVLLGGACGGNVTTDCTLDQYTVGDLDAQDCGDFTFGDENYTEAAMVAAQRCVLNAIVRGRAFRLVYDANNVSTGGPGTGLRAGLVGSMVGGVMHLTYYAASTSGADMSVKGDVVSAQVCETVVATPDCKPVVGEPCLQCGEMLPGTIACRG
jgi:hypothetical protein